MTKEKNKSLFSSSRWQLYVLLAPFLTIFTLMMVLPVLASMVLSFFNFDMVSMPTFAGLDNYIRMFLHDDIFPIVLKNTILLAILTGPAGFLLSFVLAWFINEFGRGPRTLFSFMFYAPSLAGHAVYIWQILFSSDSYGYINSFLMSLGFITEPIAWLSNSSYIVPIVVLVQLWSSLGISFLSNLSGLQNINTELYEAGAIDGIRNRWQELWYITLPGMKHMLLFSAVMQIASAFSISSIITQLAGYPTVGYAADTIVSYLNDVGTVKYEMGYASALSVILFLLMVTTRWVTNKLINKTGR
ncbi:MAG: sugar ABC transporter permease [Clostridia bacterium]|nr:sugar ABC transporter permease [Oscillospiraceae bacterium]MBO5358488.1 sugar ABC transporter permease [Clostridia bacterium]